MGELSQGMSSCKCTSDMFSLEMLGLCGAHRTRDTRYRLAGCESTGTINYLRYSHMSAVGHYSDFLLGRWQLRLFNIQSGCVGHRALQSFSAYESRVCFTGLKLYCFNYSRVYVPYTSSHSVVCAASLLIQTQKKNTQKKQHEPNKDYL